MAAGYDISASASQSTSSATGATNFGSTGNSGLIIGGSNGISTTIVVAIVVGLMGIWWFFLRKKKR